MKFPKTLGLSVATLLVSLAAPITLRHLPGQPVSFESLKAVAAAPLLQVQESLSNDDEVAESENGNRLVDIHQFSGKAGQTISLRLESQDFDPYLVLFDSDGEVIESNDDLSENNKNSGMEITLPYDGEYFVLVTSYEIEGQGDYELSVIPDE